MQMSIYFHEYWRQHSVSLSCIMMSPLNDKTQSQLTKGNLTLTKCNDWKVTCKIQRRRVESKFIEHSELEKKGCKDVAIKKEKV